MDDALIDAAGTRHTPAGPGARIACLVPSITELICALALAPQLVARTGFCIHPADVVRRIPKVGGTKDVDLEKLRALAPTHVVLNMDENTRATAEALAAFVPHLVVTHPNAPEDNLALYRLLGGLFGREGEAEVLCDALSAALDAARRAAAAWPVERVLYLIWKDPWMTVAPDTYIARTLATVGWATVGTEGADARVASAEDRGAAFSRDRLLVPSRDGPAAPREHERTLLPADGSTSPPQDWRTLPPKDPRPVPTVGAARYPQVDLRAAAAQADLVLLSSEPYRFRERHVAELRRALAPPAQGVVGEDRAAGEQGAAGGQGAARRGARAGPRVALIDGEMTSWYGSRAIAGLAYLPRLRAALALALAHAQAV